MTRNEKTEKHASRQDDSTKEAKEITGEKWKTKREDKRPKTRRQRKQTKTRRRQHKKTKKTANENICRLKG